MSLEENVPLLWIFEQLLTVSLSIAVQKNSKFSSKIQRGKKGFGVIFKHPDKWPDILKTRASSKSQNIGWHCISHHFNMNSGRDFQGGWGFGFDFLNPWATHHT